MDRKLFMGVDLGTSFIKSGVYSLDGELLASWSETVPDERPASGIFIQRGELLYASVCTCIRKTVEILGEAAKSVRAIAFTGQMAGSIGVGENWSDITTWSCTLDGRYLPYAGKQQKLYGEDMYHISGTGSPVMCAKYDWFKEEFPEEHKKIVKYVMLNGYIIGKLSRIPVEEAMIDYSLIAWTGMADMKRRCWSEKLCEELGVDISMLPKITGSESIGGYLHEETAKELGLEAGIPLVLGAGDKVSGCVGAGILRDGDMIFEAASYGAVSCKVKDVKLDLKGHRYDMIGTSDDSSYYAHKYIQGSGITIDWFIEEFMKSDGVDKKETFRKMEELCKDIPVGSEKMMAVGLLGGSAIPFDSEIRGLFMGHTWAHTKGHFYHALLESFSYDLALTLKSLDQEYPEYADSPIRLIGGGAKSSVWPQMLADATGRKFERLDREDVALWGAAMIAAAGIGELSDIQESAAAHVGVKEIYLPDSVKNNAYQPYIQMYKQLCAETHSLFQRIAELK